MSYGIAKLAKMKLNELQAKFAEVVGETTRSSNRTCLIRRITEAIASSERVGTTGAMASKSMAEDPVSCCTKVVDDASEFTQIDIPALQALYGEIIGRTTSSTNRRYLIWKIREARKGRVPIGPRKNRQGEQSPIQVLPLRMDPRLVEQGDEAWRRLGLRNRMDLFRRSLQTYLAGVGEPDLATCLATEI